MKSVSTGAFAVSLLLRSQPSFSFNFFWCTSGVYCACLLYTSYVRIPIKFARKYFAENGGNSGDLKLFINDYNLESWWDNNKKVKSLINWIKRWESDGETKIDGIGTQTVSYTHLVEKMLL